MQRATAEQGDGESWVTSRLFSAQHKQRSNGSALLLCCITSYQHTRNYLLVGRQTGNNSVTSGSPVTRARSDSYLFWKWTSWTRSVAGPRNSLHIQLGVTTARLTLCKEGAYSL